MSEVSPRPHEPDVRLSIFLHGLRFEYLACRSAATGLVREHHSRHYVDAAAILPLDGSAHYPRLPHERLYLDLEVSRSEE